MAACTKCGGPLPLPKGRHRPRKMCLTCRPSRAKSPLNGPVDASAQVTQLRTETDLVSATVRKLSAAGRLHDPEGIVVVELAKAIVNGAHSGSSLAALSREYTRALAAAVAVVEADESDGVEWGVG